RSPLESTACADEAIALVTRDAVSQRRRVVRLPIDVAWDHRYLSPGPEFHLDRQSAVGPASRQSLLTSCRQGSQSLMKRALVRFASVCLLVLGAGCLTDPPSHAINWIDALGASQTAPAPDLVVMDVALLEAVPGDDFLTSSVWSQVDEQVVAVNHRP